MNLDIGDRVRVVAAKGGKGLYSYGTSVSEVPLGSKGNLFAARNYKYYPVTIDGKDYYFSEEEIVPCSSLSDLGEKDLGYLLSEEPSVESEEVLPEGFVDKLKRFFGWEARRFYSKFVPRFNSREEFAVWINENFPEDEDILAHKNEVYSAARLACRHGIQTAEKCVRSEFEYQSRQLEQVRRYNFPIFIRNLVSLIERVSVNMSTPERRHYGTFLDRRERE